MTTRIERNEVYDLDGNLAYVTEVEVEDPDPAPSVEAKIAEAISPLMAEIAELRGRLNAAAAAAHSLEPDTPTAAEDIEAQVRGVRASLQMLGEEEVSLQEIPVDGPQGSYESL